MRAERGAAEERDKHQKKKEKKKAADGTWLDGFEMFRRPWCWVALLRIERGSLEICAFQTCMYFRRGTRLRCVFCSSSSRLNKAQKKGV